MAFFPDRKAPTQKQVNNIRKAVEYLLQLFDCCPELGRDPYRVEILQKLRDLTSNDDEVRKNFGTDDSFLDDKSAQGWTEKFLRIFWNRFILIHTSIMPDGDLDETQCEDKATLLYLALTLWHETAHWEGNHDGWVQAEDKKIHDILMQCACITSDPCAERLMETVRDMGDSDRERIDWWMGVGNWLKEFLASWGILGCIVLVIMFIIGLKVAAIGTLTIGWAALIAFLIALLLKILWWWFTCFLPWLWEGVKNICGATFSGWNWTGSGPVSGGGGSTARATTTVVNPGAASGTPDGNTVALIACQSVILAMLKPIADERKVYWPGGLDDLRVTASGGPYEVEVANSPVGPWEKCDPATASNTLTFDVPWWGSPWSYVRIHALGPTQLDSVEDIDY